MESRDSDPEEEFGAKALNVATKRKFDYSFSSSTDEDPEETKNDSDDSVDEIKDALMVQKPSAYATAAAQQSSALAMHDPIHNKVIAEEDASEEE